MDVELTALLALQLLPGAGPAAWSRILELSGTAHAFITHGFGPELEARLTAVQRERFGPAARRKAWQYARSELELAEAQGVLAWGRHQDAFPERLRQCKDAPLVLFTRGTPTWNSKKVLAVVGTRRCSQKGLRWTQSFVRNLPPGVVVVSGLALGIDGAVHKAALERGLETWGVHAAGLHAVSPRQHAPLANNMIASGGAVISECPFEQTPTPGAFPRRNRIVAGLVDAVVVVESAIKGGSLITARLAHGYDREVYAVPGRPDETVAQGCLQLLVHHAAAVAVDAGQVVRELGWGAGTVPASLTPVPAHLQDLHAWLAQFGPVHRDELYIKRPGSQTTAGLLELECLGRVRVLPGTRYEAI